MPVRRTREASEEAEYTVSTPSTTKKLRTTKRAVEPSHEEEEEEGEGQEELEPFRKDFYESVYRAVKTIPYGKVTSYGMIGKLIGHPRHSRMVGAALKCLPTSMSSPYLPLQPAPRSSSGDSSSSTATNSTMVSATTTTDIFDYLDNTRIAMGLDHDVFNFDFPSSTITTTEEEVLPAPLPNPSVCPWWRVVSSTGVISPRGNDRAVQRQADYLIAEGVEVKDGPRNSIGGDGFGLRGVSGGKVSMAVYGWKG